MKAETVFVARPVRPRRRPIRLTATTVYVPRRLGSRRVERASLRTVVYVQRLITIDPWRPRTAVVALDARDRRRIDLRSGVWPAVELWQLALALDLPIRDYRIVTAGEVRDDVPAAIRWRAAHPSLALFLALVACTAIAAAARIGVWVAG